MLPVAASWPSISCRVGLLSVKPVICLLDAQRMGVLL